MRRFLPLAAALLLAPPALASEAVRQVTLAAHVESRTSLRVSADTLVFVVPSDGGIATASVDYTAAARTRQGTEVMLTVEPLRSMEGPGGAADVDTVFSMGGEAGTEIELPRSGPVRVMRWFGSGAREGRLTFRLAAAAPGVYTVPVRILLSAP